MKFTWRVFYFNDYFCIQKAIDNLLDEFLPRHKSVITSAASEDDDSDFESEDSTETVRIRDEEMNQNIDKFNRLYNSENKEQSDESEDEEYISCNGCSSIQNLKEKVSAACTCGKNCSSVVPLEEIQNSNLSSNELSREERDMFIMGKLSCVGDGSSTQRGKERKRRR